MTHIALFVFIKVSNSDYFSSVLYHFVHLTHIWQVHELPSKLNFGPILNLIVPQQWKIGKHF